MVQLGSSSFTYEVSGENWGNLPNGWRYLEATAVAVDSKDEVYVFNRGGHPVIVFDQDGNFRRSWGEDVFTTPHGIAIGPDDSVYCTDAGDHTVRKFTPDGELMLTIGESGTHSPLMSGHPFNKPCHVAVDPRNGDIFVADGYGNARVHKYSGNGEYQFSWGESGTDPGQFNIVHNIATDREGRVYVADRENRRIQIFSPDGQYQEQWVNMSRAAAVIVDHRTDLVYVGEYFGGQASNSTGTKLGPRVTILDIGGNVLARLSDEPYGDEPGRFYSPHAIAVDSQGNIYVAEVSYSDYGRVMDPPRELRSMQKLVKQQ
jgi:DNA-binding beta-propeller fold protein YncE